jgi:hypothetical protein
MPCVILVWQRITEEGDAGVWQRYRLAGTWNKIPFCCEVAMEIDGRDGEYKRIFGPDMDFASPNGRIAFRWDDLLEAMSQNESMSADMASDMA